MNADERKLKVKKVIENTLFKVLGGSIQETTCNSLVDAIDALYLPHLKENGESEQIIDTI